jgi:hypothetical protein
VRDLAGSEHAEAHSGAGIVGVPGFWQELSGVVHIWKPRNYLMPLLVIPYKDANGLIQACQIRYTQMIFRLMRKDTVGFPHHKNDMAPVLEHQYISLFLRRKVLITEGALKADTVVRFRPNARVIATSGVTCSHSELVKAARPYTALIAFDADYSTNWSINFSKFPGELALMVFFGALRMLSSKAGKAQKALQRRCWHSDLKHRQRRRSD